MDMKLQQVLDEYVERNYWYSKTNTASRGPVKLRAIEVPKKETTVQHDEKQEEINTSDKTPPKDTSYEDKTTNKETTNKVSLLDRLKIHLDDILSHLDDTFSERVLKIIREKGFSDVDIYKKANLNRKIFSKLRNDRKYQPSRNTALALIIALELNENEAVDLLRRAGFSLSNGTKEDVIISFFIAAKIYDVHLLNEALDHYGLPILGERKSQNVASETTKEDN